MVLLNLCFNFLFLCFSKLFLCLVYGKKRKSDLKIDSSRLYFCFVCLLSISKRMYFDIA